MWPVGACWHEFVSAIAAVLDVKQIFNVVCWSISKLHVFFFKRKKHNTSGATFLNIIDLRPGSSSNITASSSSFLYFFSADTRIRTYNNNRQVDSSQPHQPPPEIFFIFFLFFSYVMKIKFEFLFALPTDENGWLAPIERWTTRENENFFFQFLLI